MTAIIFPSKFIPLTLAGGIKREKRGCAVVVPVVIVFVASAFFGGEGGRKDRDFSISYIQCVSLGCLAPEKTSSEKLHDFFQLTSRILF